MSNRVVVLRTRGGQGSPTETPVLGSVLCVRNHCVMCSRSYVCPLATWGSAGVSERHGKLTSCGERRTTSTGSLISSCDIGQQKLCGGADGAWAGSGSGSFGASGSTWLSPRSDRNARTI